MNIELNNKISPKIAAKQIEKLISAHQTISKWSVGLGSEKGLKQYRQKFTDTTNRLFVNSEELVSLSKIHLFNFEYPITYNYNINKASKKNEERKEKNILIFSEQIVLLSKIKQKLKQLLLKNDNSNKQLFESGKYLTLLGKGSKKRAILEFLLIDNIQDLDIKNFENWCADNDKSMYSKILAAPDNKKWLNNGVDDINHMYKRRTKSTEKLITKQNGMYTLNKNSLKLI